jgi:hypothetical protein
MAGELPDSLPINLGGDLLGTNFRALALHDRHRDGQNQTHGNQNTD